MRVYNLYHIYLSETWHVLYIFIMKWLLIICGLVLFSGQHFIFITDLWLWKFNEIQYFSMYVCKNMTFFFWRHSEELLNVFDKKIIPIICSLYWTKLAYYQLWRHIWQFLVDFSWTSQYIKTRFKRYILLVKNCKKNRKLINCSKVTNNLILIFSTHTHTSF